MVKKLVQYNFIYEYMERWVRKNAFDLNIDHKFDFGGEESVKSSTN